MQATITHPATVDQFLATVQGISAASPEIAQRRPVADCVSGTLTAAATSAHTRRSYTTGIGLFLEWFGETYGHVIPAQWLPLASQAQEGRRRQWQFSQAPAVVFTLISAAAVDAYMDTRISAGEAPGTLDARQAAVKTLCAVMLRDNVLTPAQGQQLGIRPYQARRRRQKTVTGRRLSAAEVGHLRQAIDASSPKGKRDLAILDVALYAGCRRSEIAELTPADLIMDQGRPHLHVMGKNRKERRIPLHPTLQASLTQWTQAAGIEAQAPGPLFPTVDRWGNVSARPIDPNVVERIVAESAAAANLAPLTGPAKLAPHDARRTFARNLHSAGVGLTEIQYLLGHADPGTTARYIGVTGSESAAAIDRLSY